MSEVRKPARVAIIGPRGIGKHHAHWWWRAGAEVCALVGTNADSLARSTEVIRSMIPFSGRCYTHLDEMLPAENPDFVDICSPPECHAEHIRASLDAGCDVLCEKPFVFDRAWTSDILLDQAKELVAHADSLGRHLVISTQYTMAARWVSAYWAKCHAAESINSLAVELMSPAHPNEQDAVRVWIELSPHLMIVLIEVFPDSEVQWDTLKTEFAPRSAKATFSICTAGRSIPITLRATHALEPPKHLRRITVNGMVFQFEGKADAEGVYGTRITTPQGDFAAPDFVRELIRCYHSGEIPVDNRSSVKNLEWMLRILASTTSTGITK